MSGLVRFSAMVGTILVLRRLHSIPLTILVVAVSFLFIRAIQKGKFESPGYIISVLSLLWGGFSASVYLALGKIVPTWQIARVVIGVVAGFGLTIYLGAFLLGKITQKFHKPSLWKCIGIFCALFMLTFGLTYLFFSDQQVVRAKPPQTHEFVQPIPPIPQPPSPKVTEPAKIELLKPVGGIGGILLLC
jgi:hypothetical protein